MNILIAGGTGFIGSELCVYLVNQGHMITVRTRNTKLVKANIKTVNNLSEIAADQKIDVAINLAGEPIANKRWSEKQKHLIRDSRLSITQEFIDFFKRSDNPPELFISSSAIGYYGIQASDDAISENSISENSSKDSSFSSALCGQWEATAMQAEVLGIRTCLLRTGIVLGKEGGALSKMLFPFKCGLGGKIGSGKQWMPWIHLNDIVRIINRCITDKHLSGAINCTAPNPVTNEEFTYALGFVLNRPTILSVPASVIRILMGEMGNELLLSGKKVIPSKLNTLGFTFNYDQLIDALKDIVKK